MGDAVRHCFANLANFGGRDDRATFWWWVLLVVIVTFGLNLMSGIIFVASAVGDAFTSASSGADQAQIETQMMQGMAGGMSTQLYFGIFVSLLGLGAILAAFIRRLRDAGLPVFIAIVPVLTTIWGIYTSITLGGQVADLMAAGDVAGIEALNQSSLLSSLVTYAGYLVVLGCGAIPSRK